MAIAMVGKESKDNIKAVIVGHLRHIADKIESGEYIDVDITEGADIVGNEFNAKDIPTFRDSKYRTFSITYKKGE